MRDVVCFVVNQDCDPGETLEPVKPEPALSVGGVVSALAALLTLLVAFGVSLTPDQTAAVLGFAAVAGPIIAGAVIRGKVRPVATSRDI